MVMVVSDRAQSAAYASGWAGFTQLSLDNFADRKTGTYDMRNITLDKTNASQVVKTYVRKNLRLDNSDMPTGESFLLDKSRPVLMNVSVFNPVDLPVTDSGYVLSETTIKIVLQLPYNVGLGDFKVSFYGPVTVFANYHTFITQSQIN